MPLKGAMRRRAVSKRWRWAERWEGASPAACLALRERLPLAYLTYDASQSSSKPPCAAVETDAEYRSGAAEGGREAPVYPLPGLGSPRAWTGPRGTGPLSHRDCVRQDEPGRLREGGQDEWAGGKGDPNDTPRSSRRVGGGRGVGAQESWGHQDEDGRRRPLAGGKTGAKGSSERASGPRCMLRGCGSKAKERFMVCCHGEGPQVLSRMRCKPHVRFSTGAMRKRAC